MGTYCEERSEAKSLIQEVLSKSNWASRYTLALAGVGGSIEDSTPPETYITQAPNGIATSADVAFSWSGSDDVTPTSELVYSYYLDGFDSGWSSWTSDTSKEYTGLLTADYVFKVKAKDQTGNVEVDGNINAKNITILDSSNNIQDLRQEIEDLKTRIKILESN